MRSKSVTPLLTEIKQLAKVLLCTQRESVTARHSGYRHPPGTTRHITQIGTDGPSKHHSGVRGFDEFAESFEV
jgi:hypothetical protein